MDNQNHLDNFEDSLSVNTILASIMLLLIGSFIGRYFQSSSSVKATKEKKSKLLLKHNLGSKLAGSPPRERAKSDEYNSTANRMTEPRLVEPIRRPRIYSAVINASSSSSSMLMTEQTPT